MSGIRVGMRARGIIFAAMACSFFAAGAQGQTQSVPMDSPRWEISARESRAADHLGRKSLYLKGGLAVVKDSQFTDGTIEFDMAFGEERGFMGAFWRMQDAGNYEEFYVRPHQSGNPDANQYQPVFNGNAAWQLYHGEGYGAPVRYEFNQWIAVKIVVSGKNAEIYIRDMEKPALFVSEQKREIRAGKVGLSVGNFAGAHFSNFRYSATSAPALRGTAKAVEAGPAGTVTAWQVSNVIAGKSLEGKFVLTAAEKQGLTWTKLAAEATGITNLARVAEVGEEKNTVFARLVIVSESEQVKKFRFGFSDAVKVYFNDRLIYGGNDIYQSRDYRYLGTMGLFDEVYLPLRKGENELWLAVTETFGGWGVKGLFEDRAGIRVKE